MCIRDSYRTVWKGNLVYLLQQVDDFALACKDETTAKEIYSLIGERLQTDDEEEPPFNYFGLLEDFNGVDVHQYKDCIQISCPEYIERIVTSHEWNDKPEFKTEPTRPTAPLPDNCINVMYESFVGTKTGGPKENAPEHKKLEKEMGFSYRTLLGEMMYTYVTYRLDIAYAITTLSKFSSAPTKLHYQYLKQLLVYLFRTRHWGIQYHRICREEQYFEDLELAPEIQTTPLPKEFEKFPKIDPTVLTCFVDAAYANDPRKRRSTTGYAIMMACLLYTSPSPRDRG